MSVQDMHERLKKANERRNCGAEQELRDHLGVIEGLRLELAAREAELARLRAVNAELERKINDIAGDAAKNLVDATAQDDENKRLRAVNAELEKKYENRGHLMDAYVTALAEIADGRESPVEYARTVLRQSSETLIESAKALSRAEQAKMEVEK